MRGKLVETDAIPATNHLPFAARLPKNFGLRRHRRRGALYRIPALANHPADAFESRTRPLSTFHFQPRARMLFGGKHRFGPFRPEFSAEIWDRNPTRSELLAVRISSHSAHRLIFYRIFIQIVARQSAASFKLPNAKVFSSPNGIRCKSAPISCDSIAAEREKRKKINEKRQTKGN